MTAEPDHDDDARAELLARLLAGEIDDDSEQVLARLAADPQFAAEMHQLLGLDVELRALQAGEDTEYTAQSAAEEPWPGADAAMRALVDGKRGPRRHRPWLWPVLLAAALVIGVIIWQTCDSLPTAPPELRLAAEQLWPNGPTTAAELAERGFNWGAISRRPSAELQLTVLAADGSQLHGPIEVGAGERWQPPSDLLRDLPTEFRWQLRLLTPGQADRQWQAPVTLTH